MPIAYTRAVSPSIDRCELTHLAREPIDVQRATSQHADYERALASMGCAVRRLPALPEHPDAVFVEDAAVVFDEVAVATRPGARSRRGEVPAVADALTRHRPLARIEAPGTLDGGDVLRVERRVYVGASSRSNTRGAAQLAAILEPVGYTVERVAVRGCLHLKSAATEVAAGVVLLNPAWVDAEALAPARWIAVDPAEPFAANTLRVGSRVLMPAAFPRTRARLEDAGLQVITVDASELAKAEGGVTCCSVLV